jgi:hypothetical protein
MTSTPRLGLDRMAESQAEKYATYNDALQALDALVNTGVQDRDLDSPPASPGDGELWIVNRAEWAIVAVDTSNEVVEVSGDYSGRITAEDGFDIFGSTGNDGTYSVASVAYNSTSGNTEITVNEDLTDSTADGSVGHVEGAWNGHYQDVAQYYNGAWFFYAPFPGLAAYLVDEDLRIVWSPALSAWRKIAVTDPHELDQAGANDDDVLAWNATTSRWEPSASSGAGLNALTITGTETGSVADGDLGVVAIDHLADGEALTLSKAGLVLADGQPAPSSLDLEIHTLDNAGGSTKQATVLSGDGSTVYADETGSPLASYTNTTGVGMTVAVVVNNATGAAQDVFARVQGEAG